VHLACNNIDEADHILDWLEEYFVNARTLEHERSNERTLDHERSNERQMARIADLARNAIHKKLQELIDEADKCINTLPT